MGSGSSKKKAQTTLKTVEATQAFKKGSKTPSNKNTTSSSGKILVSFHSKNYQTAQELCNFLKDKNFEVFLISEDSPDSLQLREQSVQWCDVFVLISTFNYQRSPHCVELANYAKDKKKPVVSLIAQPNFSPSGSVGAISLAWGISVQYIESTQENNEKVLQAIQQKMSGVQSGDVAMPTHDTPEGAPVQTQKIPGSYVCIVYHQDGSKVAQMLKDGQGVSNKGAQANALSSQPIKIGSPNSDNMGLIKDCKVFIPVLTTGYQSTEKCQQEYEYARKCQKVIVPVKGEKFWPSGWLSLGIAGKLYYELIDANQAYTHHPNVPDSNPMNDFIFAVMTAMQGEQTEEEKEKVRDVLYLLMAIASTVNIIHYYHTLPQGSACISCKTLQRVLVELFMPLYSLKKWY